MEESELNERLSVYREMLYGQWLKISNNKRTIKDYDIYIDYLRKSLNTSLKILIGFERVAGSKDLFDRTIDKIIEERGRDFYEGTVNGIQINEIKPLYAFNLFIDKMDSSIEPSIVC